MLPLIYPFILLNLINKKGICTLYKNQSGTKKRGGTILKNSTKKGDSGTDVFLSILGNL